jgi:hypothetical protein
MHLKKQFLPASFAGFFKRNQDYCSLKTGDLSERHSDLGKIRIKFFKRQEQAYVITRSSQHKSKSNLVNNILIILFALLHVADGLITYIGLRFTSVEEVNPILTYFVHLLGLGCSITLLKLGILAVIGFLYIDRYKMHNGWGTFVLASAVSFYFWVVSNNVFLVVSA